MCIELIHFSVRQKLTQHCKACVCVCVCESLSRIRLSVTPRTVARQAPLVHGILQAKIMEWVPISFSRGSPQPKD